MFVVEVAQDSYSGEKVSETSFRRSRRERLPSLRPCVYIACLSDLCTLQTVFQGITVHRLHLFEIAALAQHTVNSGGSLSWAAGPFVRWG